MPAWSRKPMPLSEPRQKVKRTQALGIFANNPALSYAQPKDLL
jgi:hypothetical protein